MTAIYHITSEARAAEATRSGAYASESFDEDGFIHCSYAHQVVRVADLIYRGRTGMVLLEIEPSDLDCRVVDENLDGGDELFPHVYGRLPMSAVVRVHDLPCGGDGAFELPTSVSV